MKYKIEFLPIAVDDLDEIVIYIASDNKEAALKMKNTIINKIKRLRDFPKLGAPVPEKKMREKAYRMLLVERYLIFYKIIENSIYIYRILHVSRDSIIQKHDTLYGMKDFYDIYMLLNKRDFDGRVLQEAFYETLKGR